jgi:hypothetical protein
MELFVVAIFAFKWKKKKWHNHKDSTRNLIFYTDFDFSHGKWNVHRPIECLNVKKRLKATINKDS